MRLTTQNIRVGEFVLIWNTVKWRYLKLILAKVMLFFYLSDYITTNVVFHDQTYFFYERS